MRKITIAVLVLVVAVALIVGLRPMTPARTRDDYAHKAKDTAESVLSSVQTARLAAGVGTDGDAFGPYVSVLLSESEDAAAKAQGSFDRVQPPDALVRRHARPARAAARPSRTTQLSQPAHHARGGASSTGLARQAKPLRPTRRAAADRSSTTRDRDVKKIFGVTLGILTAMGGFVDIGDLVANSETGARFGMSLAWAVLLGVVGIVVYAEMAGRVGERHRSAPRSTSCASGSARARRS